MPERQRGLLDPARHRGGAPAAVLEREGELGADGAHHDLRLRVLEQRAGDGGEVARPVLARVEPADDARGRRTSPPWKWGTRPQAARSSVDLPRPRAPASTHELARLDAEATRRAARARAAPRVGVA